MAVTVIRVSRRWLTLQRAKQDREQAARTTMRGNGAAGRRTPYTACGNCRVEFSMGDVVATRHSSQNRKWWCAGCAVRLGICDESEVHV